MNLFFRISGIVAVLGLFLGAGIEIGAKRGSDRTVQASERFQKLTDTTAFDPQTGQVCKTTPRVEYSGHGVPPGVTLDAPGAAITPDPPQCEELAKR